LIESMTAAFADMPGGKGFGRRTSLTSETRNAVVQTLQGMLYLVKYLLDGSHAYVLLGIFQSNRLEGEFGIYRCVTAFLSSCCGIDDRCTSLTRDCCSLELFPEDVEVMDDAIVSVSADFSPELEAALFYVSTLDIYITNSLRSAGRSRVIQQQHNKFGLPGPPESAPMDSPSEFTTFLSRGRLKYPSEDVFQFVRLCYNYFDLVSSSEERFKCVSYFRKLLFFLYSSSPFDIPAAMSKVCLFIVNCFFKGLVKNQCDSLSKKDCNQRKIRKLTNNVT